VRRAFAAIKNLLRGRDADRDTEAELQSYLEYAADEYARDGADRTAAERAARVHLGGTAQVAEAVREARAGERIAAIARDVRFGVRSLRRTPTFTVSAILVLALGVGANAAIFSVVNAALLHPLPIRDDHRVAVVWIDNPSLGRSRVGPTGQDYLDWTRESTPFDDLFLFEHGSGTVTGAGEPEQVKGLRVTTNFGPFLGVRPIVGRTFDASDRTKNVILISEGYWQRTFNRDPAVTGRALTLNGVPYSVIGVLPGNATFWYPADVVVPWPLERLRTADSDLGVFGRLKPSETVASAQAAMNVVAAHVADMRPQDRRGWGIVVVPLRDVTVQYIRMALVVLAAAVGFVLLIACANVAGLLIVRALGRQKEIAIRAALGATRARLAQQIIIESLLLGAAGGIAGLAIAATAESLLHSVIPASIPVPAAASQVPLPQGRVDLRVLTFTVAVSLGVSLLFSLGPLLACLRGRLTEFLSDGARATGSGVGSTRQRGALIVVETALAIILLVGAGLMMRTFWNLVNVRPGFDPHDVVTAQLKFADDAPDSKYRDSPGRVAAMTQFLDRVRAVPGVRSAAFAQILPLSQDDQNTGSFFVAEQPGTPSDRPPTADFRIVTDGYFETMRIPLKRGRWLTSADRADGRRVAVIDDTLARVAFGSRDPLGAHLRLGGRANAPREIVGVVGAVVDESLDKSPRPTVYIPYAQAAAQTMSLALRTGVAARSILPDVKRAIWSVDPAEPIFNVRRMDDIVSNTVSAPRLAFLLLTIFAAIALALAAVGMYGVTSYAVQQRTREIGVRVAMGASRQDILRMVIGGGLRQAALGLAIGLAGAATVSRWLATLLYGVTPLDSATVVVVSAAFVVVACAANAAPAWRAATVNPIDALTGR
jgi:putative ABC transport system permease protein